MVQAYVILSFHQESITHVTSPEMASKIIIFSAILASVSAGIAKHPTEASHNSAPQSFSYSFMTRRYPAPVQKQKPTQPTPVANKSEPVTHTVEVIPDPHDYSNVPVFSYNDYEYSPLISTAVVATGQPQLYFVSNAASKVFDYDYASLNDFGHYTY
ncbi:uncharacterized protein LOC129764620 [Toxorhynchites rutilus septentrionalis]|uniref:uncharacterized protein LOC129764620 n=1 Tax=Toxorhynchites rutilus septentrionalis TaxID=329112 RepID=UPI002478758F|nr:uncharacterized protein LOC129764620 [Toxorhynchites rutilus septentrionalis]